MRAVKVDGETYQLPLTHYGVELTAGLTEFDIILPEVWPALVHPAVAPEGYAGQVTVVPMSGGADEVRDAVVVDASGNTIPVGPITVAENAVSFELNSALTARRHDRGQRAGA